MKLEKNDGLYTWEIAKILLWYYKKKLLTDIMNDEPCSFLSNMLRKESLHQ